MIQFRNIPTVARKTGFLSRGGLFRSTTAVTMLAALGLAGVAQAQSTWTAGSGDYGDADNWDSVTVPGSTTPPTNNTDPATVGGNGVANVAGADTFTPSTVTIEGGGTLSVDGRLGTLASQTVITVNDGTLSVTGTGTVDGDVDINGMTSNTTLDGTVTGNVDITRGQLNVGGTIEGDLIYDGAVGQNSVDVSGKVEGRTEFLGASDVDVSGDLENGLVIGTGSDVTISGSVTGAPTTVGINTTNSPVGGGTLTVTGAGVIDGGGLTLNGSSSDGVVTNNGTIVGLVTANNGTLTTTGTIDGDLTQSAGGTVNAAGTITGDVTVNSGDFNVTGALDIGDGVGDDVTNSARINVQGGPVTISGDVTNNSGGSIRVAAGEAFNFDTMNNSGRLGLGTGTPGGITATFGGSIVGTSGPAGTMGSTLDMQNGVAGANGDTIVIQGGVRGTNMLSIDVDLTTTNGGTADVLDVDGVLEDGAGQGLTVDVDSIRGPLGYTLQSQGITIATAGTLESADLTTALEGDLPTGPSGLILYRLETDENNNNEVQLFGNLNPALGSVAASLSSVQSLVTTTVNRPSGAYVSGIAFDAPGNCSTGNWARVAGGRAETESTSTNAAGRSLTSSGELDYGGVQGGIDYGCFEAFDGGWDVSGGLLIGTNLGHFSEEASGLITTGEFDQYFFGGYIAASTGNWSGELQLRHANSNYTFDNPDLDIRDADVSTDSNSMSGSLTYRYDLDNNGLALLPTIGFNLTRTSTSTLQFEDPAGRNVGEMAFEDHTSKTGFVGTTLSRTNVNAAARSATNTFVTATYYMDGSGSRDSTFSTSDGLATESLTTDELGNFGELSVGGSYVRVLSDTPGQVRQVNYSVRADYRFGEDVSGAGITGQMRLQF